MTGETLKAKIAERIERDPRLRKIRAKTAKGKATKADSFTYSRICSEIMSEELAKAVLDLDDREGICAALLRGNYEEIMQTADAIQRSIDEKQGIHMQPRRPAFPAERVQQIAHSLVDPTVPDEKIVRRAGSTATVSMSFHDDFVQENAAFRAKAGLKCYITRETDGSCCKWCSALAGRYEYGEEPEDVYRRHDNCCCTVTYENGRQRQDVWSKRAWEAPAAGAGAKEPARLTPEQAAAKEAEHLPKRLTRGAESGRIRLSDSDDYWHPITENAIQSVPRVSAFSDDLNAVVQKQCRELLSSLIEDDIGTEGTVSISLQDFTTETAKGESGEGGVKPIHLTEPYISIHNHPSDETFSALDLRLLCTDDQCRAIIVVGNSGETIFVLQKTDAFDADGMMRYIRTRIDHPDSDETLEEFVKGSERYGTKYHK